MPEEELEQVEGELFSVLDGAKISSAGLISYQAINFLTNLVLTRSLSTGLFGIFALARRITVVTTTFTNLGSSVGLIRFIPKSEERKMQGKYLGMSYVITLSVSVLAAVSIFHFSGLINSLTLDQQVFVPVLKVFAGILVAESLIHILYRLFRSKERIRLQVLVQLLLRPLAWLAGAGTAVLLGFSLVGISFLILFFLLALLFYSFYRSYGLLKPSLSFSLEEIQSMFDYSLPILMSQLGELLRKRVDLLFVGAFLTAADTGIYEISLFLAALIFIPLEAFNQLMAPVSSRMYKRKDISKLNTVYSVVTRWITTSALFLSAYILIFRYELLALFGEEFQKGAMILVVFVAGHLIASISGATEWLLRMTDHQYLSALNNWVLGILNIVILYFAVEEYGMIGVAVTISAMEALANLLRLSEIYLLEDLFPWNLNYVKPFIAVAVMSAFLYSLGIFLNGPKVLVTGLIGGIIVYGTLLYLLGIEDMERDLLLRIFT